MIALYHQYSFVLPIPDSIEEEEKVCRYLSWQLVLLFYFF